jgi:hypothetical protein
MSLPESREAPRNDLLDDPGLPRLSVPLTGPRRLAAVGVAIAEGREEGMSRAISPLHKMGPGNARAHAYNLRAVQPSRRNVNISLVSETVRP